VQPFDYIRQEGAVLKKAPLAFVGLAIVFFGVGIAVAHWYDSDKLNDKDDQLRRYRVALGVEPGSPNALVELTNPELKSKALLVSSSVQALCEQFNKRSAEIKAQLDAKKIDEKGANDRQQALMKDISAQFDHNLRADALNVHSELLRRLDPKAAAAVCDSLSLPTLQLEPRSVCSASYRVDWGWKPLCSARSQVSYNSWPSYCQRVSSANVQM
jgi:hypothetical protein